VTPIRGILGILETMHTQKYKKAHTVWEEKIYNCGRNEGTDLPCSI